MGSHRQGTICSPLSSTNHLTLIQDASPNAYAWKVYTGNIVFQLLLAEFLPAAEAMNLQNMLEETGIMKRSQAVSVCRRAPQRFATGHFGV